MASKKSGNDGRAVLVTTEHRGVFFGYLVGDPAKEKVMLRACRNVVYWDTESRGFVGLAATGPTNGCRVTKPAGDDSVLFDITAVIACTDEAAKRFEDAPWSR
jgi:hypothetical protein